jgi:hypothetical protein
VLFSVIIPTLNRRAFLERALESVWAQAFTNYEVIVVDDGSDDGTQQYLTEFGDRLRWISQSNRGPGAARNAGVALAQGQYLAFLDSDDLWFPWTLQVFSELVLAYGRPAILSAKFADFCNPEELRSISATDTPSAAVFDRYFDSSHQGYFVGAGMMVIAKTTFKRSGGFVEDRLNAEDHDLALKMGNEPGFVQVDAPITLARRIHPRSEIGNVASTGAGIARVIAAEKNGGYPGGQQFQAERQRIICMHARSAMLSCIRGGYLSEAWQLYNQTFLWQLYNCRFRFLAATPFLLAYKAVLPGAGGPP